MAKLSNRRQNFNIIKSTAEREQLQATKPLQRQEHVYVHYEVRAGIRVVAV